MNDITSLLAHYSISEILTILIVLSLSLKGCISFFDWAGKKTKELVYKADQPLKMKENIQHHEQEIKKLDNSITELSKLINLLIESDKDDIKAFITRQHHYFVYQKGWIDDYSLDCIEQRYRHYQNQGGNSFIYTLMKELRRLPKQPPEVNEN